MIGHMAHHRLPLLSDQLGEQHDRGVRGVGPGNHGHHHHSHHHNHHHTQQQVQDFRSNIIILLPCKNQ